MRPLDVELSKSLLLCWSARSGDNDDLVRLLNILGATPGEEAVSFWGST